MTITREAVPSSATPLLNSGRARSLLLESGFDGVVTSTLENTFYFSGVWNFGYELFPYSAEAYVVANADEVAAGTVVTSVGEADIALAANPTIKGILTYGAFSRVVPDDASLTRDEERIKEITVDAKPAATAIEALASALEQQGLVGGSIGVDERGANRFLIDALTARLPGTRFTAAAGLLGRIRMVKTPAEHLRLIRTLRITEAAFEATIAAAYSGVTERELKRVFDTAIVAAGARPAFALIRFGRGMALGQVEPDDTKLASGDYIWFDIGCTYRGYRSDIGRVVAFGDPSKRLCDLYEASTQGQDRAFETMRPGTEARTVFGAAVERVGVEFYDAPLLAPSVDTPLETGMVFEVETPYYELGFGGTFIEDTVIIRSDGPEIVTRLSRELRVIEP